MKYNERLALFFKSKNISQKEAAKRLGFSPAMISRYLSGTSVFPPEFLTSLLKVFPDINLVQIFSEADTHQVNVVKEPFENNIFSEKDVVSELENIEKQIGQIREFLARKRHDK